MGGSGSHNDVQYERGSPFDFDNWAKFTGDSSWRYENVLKYFKRTENYKGKFVGKDENSKNSIISAFLKLYVVALKSMIGFDCRSTRNGRID